MRLSPSNIVKVTACDLASGGKWGDCSDAYLKNDVKITSKTAYHYIRNVKIVSNSACP